MYKLTTDRQNQLCAQIAEGMIDVLPHPKGWGFSSVPNKVSNCGIDTDSNPKVVLHPLLQWTTPCPLSTLTRYIRA